MHVTIHAAAPDEPLSVTFEQAAEKLQSLPRLYFEPDGSFVWVSSEGEQAWQIDGQLQDRGSALDHVEIKGRCPSERLDELLRALGWPARPLAFQLVSEGVLLDEAAFRQRFCKTTSE